MRSPTVKLYIFVCALSVLIILFALLTQYMWGEPFYDFDDDLLVFGSQLNTGRYSDAPRTVRAKVSYHGFVFDFSVPLIHMVNSEVLARYSIRSYHREQSALIVSFEKDIAIHFEFSPHKQNELLIRIHDPQGHLLAEDMSYLSFGYRCSAPVCTVEQRIINVHDSADAYYLYLPPHSIREHSKIKISLYHPVRTLRFSSVHIPQRTEELAQYSVNMFEQEPILPAEFMHRAYENWGEHAYSSLTGTWIDREGAVHFDEDIMLAYLSEALVRNDYTRAFNAMRRSYQQNKEHVTISSLLHFGDSRFFLQKFNAQNREREQQLTATIGSDGVLNDIGLLRYMHFSAPHAIRDTIIADILKRDYFDFEIPEVLNVLEYFLFEPDIHYNSIQEIINQIVLPHIVVSENGLFISADEKHIDFYITLRMAFVLKSFARIADDEQLLQISTALQYSVLRMADAYSYVPRSAVLSGRRLTDFREHIDLAELYYYLTDNAHYATPVLLNSEQRLWLMSAVAVENVSVNEDEIRLLLAAPLEHGLYILIGNSDRPKRVQIGGAEYGIDRDFQSRTEGWNWFREYRSVVIKFYRTDDNNEIVIRY